MQTSSSTGNGNKLLLVFSRASQKRNIETLIGQNLQTLNVGAGYNFEFQMPSLQVFPSIKEETRHTWFANKPYKASVKTGYNHVLVFPRELTDAELYFWRVFKLGFLTSFCGTRCD